MGEELHGVKETKELNTFLAKLGNMVSKALADGKVDQNDAMLVMDPLLVAVPAFQGISLVGQEYKDLSEAEAIELKEQLAIDLSLDPSHAKFELIAETIYGASHSVAAAIMAIVEAKNTPPEVVVE